jgi:hypothetical protein
LYLTAMTDHQTQIIPSYTYWKLALLMTLTFYL